MTQQAAALWFLPFVIPIGIWVALSDLKRMKIPNKAVLALVGVYLVVGPFVLPLEEWGLRWVHLVVVLIITFILNMIGQMGAGDAKFLAAMAPFVALADAGNFLVILAVSGLVTVLIKLLVGMVPAIKRATADWESFNRARIFPYGLALSLALILYLVLSAIG